MNRNNCNYLLSAKAFPVEDMPCKSRGDGLPKVRRGVKKTIPQSTPLTAPFTQGGLFNAKPPLCKGVAQQVPGWWRVAVATKNEASPSL